MTILPFFRKLEFSRVLHLILSNSLFFFHLCSHVVFINSILDRSNSISMSSFSLSEFSFSPFMLTMLYIVSVSEISSSTSTNSSLVHFKSRLLVLYNFSF